MSFTIYDTGTVTLTNGSAAIVGTGTAWEIALITGGILAAQAAGNPLPIESVEDDTHATAAVNWVGATGTYAYAIARETSEAMSVVRTNDRLAQLLTRLADSGALGGDPGILLVFDTGTTDANPGEGLIRANNVSLAAATQLFISKTSRGGSNIAAFLAQLDDSSSAVKGLVTLMDPVTEEQATVLAGAVTDATNYVKLAISGHSGETGFVAGTPLSFQFSRSGDSNVPADGSITNAKLANMANATVKLRKTAGAGVPEDGSIGDLDALQVAAAVKREKLAANRTYYVRTDGNDANTGLVDSSGGAFLTLQAAWNAAAKLDLSTYDVVIQVKDGTYTGGLSMIAMPIGGNSITVQGNSVTPGNVVINKTSGDAIALAAPREVLIKDMELRTTTSGNALVARNNAQLRFSNIRFGACAGNQIHATGAVIEKSGNYSIVGSAVNHIWAEDNGMVRVGNTTITLTGTPAFSNSFIQAYYSKVTINNCTFTGTATGKRYTSSQLSLISTNGGGANYLPGSSAGSTDNGGLYL